MTDEDWAEISREQNIKIEQLSAELKEAKANYQFMVDRAADQKLDGYRELAQKVANAENKCDALRARNAALEASIASILDDFDRFLRESENHFSGRKGMQVSYHGPLAAHVAHPSVIREVRQWAKQLREVTQVKCEDCSGLGFEVVTYGPCGVCDGTGKVDNKLP